MPTVAEQLRHAREEQGLDVYQMAEVTKIKTDHIRALESAHYDAFSAQVYIRGFVRTYAKALRLDEDRLMADLDAELAQTEKFSDHPPLIPPHKGILDAIMLRLSRLNWRVATAIGVILILTISVFFWLRHRGDAAANALQKLGPGVYQPTQSQGGETLPLPTNAPSAR